MGWTKSVFKQNPTVTTGDSDYMKEHRSCFDMGDRCETHENEMVEKPNIYTPSNDSRSF